LVEDALTKKYHEEYPENGAEPSSNGTKTNDKKKNAKSKQKIYAKKFKGQLVYEHDAPTPPMIKITDIRTNPPVQTLQRIACPKCSTLFE
jgi:hypothetical protein